jgi:L-ascorbate metabolism protein UlaG (beta-lactamase superfamily)
MRITYHGHSTVGVSFGNAQLLFDPFISGNPLVKHIEPSAIPCTHLLITHGHGDHVQDAEAIAKRTHAVLVANHEIATWFEAKGVKQCVGMNIGGRKDFGGFQVRMTTAHHSSQLPDGTYGGNPGGYVVTTPEGSFHHAGDTGLTLDMQLLRSDELRFAFLPIGDHYTMGAEDAAEAATLMNVPTVIGIHYDTFPPIRIDRSKAEAAFRKRGIKLLLPGIGESMDL